MEGSYQPTLENPCLLLSWLRVSTTRYVPQTWIIYEASDTVTSHQLEFNIFNTQISFSGTSLDDSVSIFILEGNYVYLDQLTVHIVASWNA